MKSEFARRAGEVLGRSVKAIRDFSIGARQPAGEPVTLVQPGPKEISWEDARRTEQARQDITNRLFNDVKNALALLGARGGNLNPPPDPDEIIEGCRSILKFVHDKKNIRQGFGYADLEVFLPDGYKTLDDLRDSARRSRLRHFADKTHHEKVCHHSLTTGYKMEAERQMRLLDLDPSTDEAWKQAGLQLGLEQACHQNIYFIKRMGLEVWLADLERYTANKQWDGWHLSYAEPQRNWMERFNGRADFFSDAGYENIDEFLNAAGCTQPWEDILRQRELSAVVIRACRILLKVANAPNPYDHRSEEERFDDIVANARLNTPFSVEQVAPEVERAIEGYNRGVRLEMEARAFLSPDLAVEERQPSPATQLRSRPDRTGWTVIEGSRGTTLDI